MTAVASGSQATAAAPAPGPAPWSLALAGALAAAAALATSVLLDGLSERIPSLVLGVGQAIIRAAPGDVARDGIEAVGTADKPIIVAGIVAFSIALGARLGTAAVRRPRALPIGFAVAGALGSVATVWATTAGVVGTLLAAVMSVAAGVGLAAVLVRAATPSPAMALQPPAIGMAATRRRFLTAAGLGAAGVAVAGLGGRRFLQGSATEEARRQVVLPPASDAAGAVPAGADVAVEGITPIVTANRDFYRIDEALVVPAVDLGSWRLRFEGMVNQPLSLSYEDLLDEPLVERYVTLACVSNEVGGRLIGNARWLGVPLAGLLERAGVHPGAEQLVGRSVDGFTVGFPVEAAVDGRDALVAVGMNGEPLPREHGFPARLVVPGLYGYVSATKWLSSIELTTFDAFDAYWIERGWAVEGPIKTQSRIDVPRTGASVAAGTVAVAGVAWAQQRGIERVEVRVDGGPWQEATLADAISSDTWRQWHLAWDAPAGRHVLEVRATDADGDTQEERRRPVFPDGATGYHTIRVDVS